MSTGYSIIIFRADAGKSIGYGHFIRSLALAGYLKDEFECLFSTFNPSEFEPTQYQLNEITKVCTYLPIHATSQTEFDRLFIERLTGKEIVVLDNYYFQTDYQRAIRDKGCKLVCIDDMHDRHLVADLVLTAVPLQESDFSLEPYTKFLGGREHSFLREPFLNVQKRERNPTIPFKIVLAMGGADPYNLTNKILTLIEEIDSTLEVAVIAGDTVDVKCGRNVNTRIYRRLSGEEIVKLFTWADLAILPSSTICVEAFACHLPVAVGWYVDNQKESYSKGVARGWYNPLGCFLDDSSRLKKSLEKVLKSIPMPPPNIDFAKGRQNIINAFKSL